jgi:hypothetical protein
MSSKLELLGYIPISNRHYVENTAVGFSVCGAPDACFVPANRQRGGEGRGAQSESFAPAYPGCSEFPRDSLFRQP